MSLKEFKEMLTTLIDMGFENEDSVMYVCGLHKGFDYLIKNQNRN